MTDAHSTRLMLLTPELAEIEAFQPALEAALAAGDVAAVALRLAPAADRIRLERAKPLIAAVQAAGAAALLAGDDVADILGKSGADGIHVDYGDEDAVAETIGRFRPDKIVGVGGLPGRDAAMAAGEAGADYVMFGDETGPFAATLERIEWWVPIFEVPCVGTATSLDDVAALAAAGAEFAALGEAVWRHTEGPAAAVAAAEAALSLARAPTP
jgi:thiamine-phosphate pyrophosphorylase